VPAEEPFKPHDDGLLDQGDVIANVPLVKWENGKIVEGKPTRCVITSNGCTCEDYERALERGSSAVDRILIQVAPLRNAKVFPPEKQEEIKEGRRLDLFYIYGDGAKLGDQIAVLTYEQPVPASVLVSQDTVARLADWQFKNLLIHNAVSRFHIEPGELFRDELLKGGAGGG